MPGSYDAAGLNRLQLAALIKDLRVVDPAMRKALPGRLRKAAEPIVKAARDNAAAVSPNTPIKIGVRTRAAGRRGASVKIVATSPSKEPIAGLLERGSQGSGGRYIRHPLFGNWAYPQQQPTRPYLQPAVDEHRDEAIAATTEVITDVLLAMKFHP